MKLGQTSVVHFVSRLLASVLGALATIYFARLLGAETLGVYFLVLGVVSWLGIVGSLGIPVAITKRMSEGDDPFPYAAAGGLIVAGLFTVIAVMVSGVQGQMNEYIGYPAAGFVVLILFVSLAYSVITSILQGQSLVHYAGVLSPVQTGSRTLLQVGAIFVGFGITGLFIGYVAGYLLVIAGGIVLAVRNADSITRPERHHFRQIVTYAKYSWLSGMRGKAFNWADVVVLGFFVSSKLIGIYSVAWNIAQFLILFAGSVSSTLFPEMSELSAERNPQAVSNLLHAALSYSGLILIPGLVGGAVLGERILRIYGDEFTQGALVLTVLIVATLLQGYQKQFTNTLNAIDRPDIAFRVNVVFIAGNVVLNVALVYLYGWLGAATATTVSVAISLVFAHKTLSRLIDYTVPYKEIGRQWIAAGIMGGIVYAGERVETTYGLINHNVIVLLGLVGVGAGVYFALMIAISPQFRTSVADNLPFELLLVKD